MKTSNFFCWSYYWRVWYSGYCWEVRPPFGNWHRVGHWTGIYYWACGICEMVGETQADPIEFTPLQP